MKNEKPHMFTKEVSIHARLESERGRCSISRLSLARFEQKSAKSSGLLNSETRIQPFEAIKYD